LIQNNTTALILAAGDGIRLGGKPKAFIEFNGITLLEHVVVKVRQYASQIIVGVREQDALKIREMFGEDIEILIGGKTRQETVEILARKAKNPMILIQDVARPFTSQKLYTSVLEAAFEYGAATLSIPMKKRDSIALSDGDYLGASVPRENVVFIQSPYVFKTESLIDAIEQSKIHGWEESATTTLLTRAGYKLKLVLGEAANYKITYVEDLQRLGDNDVSS